MSLYLASNRPGGVGGIDIWVSKRTGAAWGAPTNLGAPINSSADDFCPTPVGGGLYFVSARPGGCGGPDIYFARSEAGGWLAPRNLGCHSDGGPNSAAGEASPAPATEGDTTVLYFSSGRPGGAATDDSKPDSDVYVSARRSDGSFTTARPVLELSTTGDDSRPNVRSDGLEIFFDRSSPVGGPADIYSATRVSTEDAWSAPKRLDETINTPANESRASVSSDGRTLVFGSTRPGGEPDTKTGKASSDIYVASRTASGNANE